MPEKTAHPYNARFWHDGSDGNIVCTLCPRQCHLAEGQRGFCFVRQNIDRRLILTTYGRSSGFCIDPIEKKPLHHFYPGTSVLSFGTAGCNLGCIFCQNWDLSRSKEFDRLSEIATPAMIAESAVRAQCRSVAFTYNDPVIFTEYAIDVAKECHARGVRTVAVTAGYIEGEARREFFEHMDAANVDLKSFSDSFYKKFALGALQPVLETLVYIKKTTATWLEITTLLIPKENDTDSELHALCQWVARELGVDVPLHFSAFHPDFKLTNHPRTNTATLRRARDIALSHGLRYVFVGNVRDAHASSTYCHACGKILIERDWYELGEYHIKDGRCEYCHATCPGYFDDVPGDWGSKRQPIHVS